MSWDLKEKNKIRKQVCKGTKPYKCVLMMPGDSCLDLKLMVKNGAIGMNTQIFIVERDKKTAKKIKDTLMELGRPKHVILQSELHEVVIPEGYKFDFVYLDTCGQLNEHVLNWLCKQVQLGIFEEGARISVAFSQWFRAGANLYNNLSEFLKKEKISLARVISPEDEITEFQADTHKVMGTVLRSIFGDIEETWLYKNSSKAVPMHVFLFKGRNGNKGLGAIVKFLSTYTDYEPEVLTPGLKAAVQRYKLTKNPRKTRGQAVKPNCADKPCTIKKERFSARREAASIAAGVIKVGRVGRPPLSPEVKLERATSELELKVSSIKRLETIIKEMDKRIMAASKSIKSLNGRVMFLENKLKSQEEPVMIKNVISDDNVKVVEVTPACNIVPMTTDEEVDLALACFWGPNWNS